MVTIDNPSIINPDVFLFAGLHVTSRHVGDQKQKHFSYWEQNYIFKNIFEEKNIVLTTKMAALLRACEPRIDNTVEPGYNEDPDITENIWKPGRITVKYVKTNPVIMNVFWRSQRTI